MLVAPPRYIPWLFVWLIVIGIIYYHKWRETTWERKRRQGKIAVLIFTLIISPFAFWGAYNLFGIENGGLFVEGFGSWEESMTIPPGLTYKSTRLSNLYTIGGASLEILTSEEVIFWIQDENVPGVRYAEYNTSETDDFYGFSLPYTYSDIFIVANWTMNIHNPGENSVDVTLVIIGWEDAGTAERWSPRYTMYLEPILSLIWLWLIAVVVRSFVSSDYKKQSQTVQLDKDTTLPENKNDLEAQDSKDKKVTANPGE